MNTSSRQSITAAVIGAGGFGRHYARILAQLNHKSLAGVPSIQRIVLTRTRFADAEMSVLRLKEDHHPAVADIIPAEVGDVHQLKRLMQAHRPGFIAIVARDPLKGDAIHSEYTRHVLPFGIVLCEKPFCPAVGDGASLAGFEDLDHSGGGHRFGLELPMVPVRYQMMGRRDLVQGLQQSPSISFFWRSPGGRASDLISDLVLHPWSLMPDFDRFDIVKVDRNGPQTVIELMIQRDRKKWTCHIHLQIGPAMRVMQWGHRTFAFVNSRFNVEMVELPGTPIDAADLSAGKWSGCCVLTTDNPLEQNIVASLRGLPTVNYHDARKSQLFLERLCGYQSHQ